MSSELKNRVLDIYNKIKAAEEGKNVMEEAVEKIVKKNTNMKNEKYKSEKQLPKKKKYDSESTADELTDSDRENEGDNEEDDEFELAGPPYLYIDYDENNIHLAQNAGYKTLFINKHKGLTKNLIDNIVNNKYCNMRTTYLVINCWKVLTRSNLNSFSFDCEDYNMKKFENKMEESIKWGSKPYLKERLTKDERKEYTPFREGVFEFLKSLYHHGVKIFIVSNSDHSFVKTLFDYYKITRYIEAIFTPSKCGLPHGKFTTHEDSYKDRRKINKERVFVCIERYIGRLPRT